MLGFKIFISLNKLHGTVQISLKMYFCLKSKENQSYKVFFISQALVCWQFCVQLHKEWVREKAKIRLEICWKVEMLLRCQRGMTIAFYCLNDGKFKMSYSFSMTNIFCLENFFARFRHCIISDGLERMKRFICHHLPWMHRLIKIPFQQNDYVYLSPSL